MDPLSHALVGGVAAALVCRNPARLRIAVTCGMLSAMAPDLDVLIRSSDNPLFALRYHRFFTHALAFVPLGALLMALFMRLVTRGKAGFGALYLYCFAGMEMHGILDAMTNYGTHLFWPFTMRRESWSIISIIDPIFTITLLVLLFFAMRKRSKRFAVIAACFACCYWTLGYIQRENATRAMFATAHERGHKIERYEVKPSLGNLITWRTQYLHEGIITVDAVHISPWNGTLLYPGGDLPLYVPDARVRQKEDLAYFTFFSDGWIALAPKHPDTIGDARFSMLPNQLDPLWGIRFTAGAHADFLSLRTRTPGDFNVLWRMILGQPVHTGLGR